MQNQQQARREDFENELLQCLEMSDDISAVIDHDQMAQSHGNGWPCTTGCLTNNAQCPTWALCP